MAKITDRSELTTPASGDILHIVDVDDTTDNAAGTSKKITTDNLSKSINLDNVSSGTTNKVFTATEQTKLSGIETSADVTDTTNVTAAGALMDSEVDADIKTLSLPANTTISAFGATLVDDADAATARTTLGAAAALGADDNYVTDAEKVVIGNTSGTNTGDEAAADLTTAGVIEVATAAETTTGTDATRAVSPDGLAGSDYGIRLITLILLDDTTDTAVADGVGDITYTVPAQLNGYNLVSAHAAVEAAGTTGTTDIQLYNVTQTADMLSTKITIDSTERTSYTAATAPVIDTANDDVATGDQIRVDVDAVSTTAAKGLQVILGFQKP